MSLSLSVVIPSEHNSVSPRSFYRVNKECPINSDSAGWYSAIYSRWSVSEIFRDLKSRLRGLIEDYDEAIAEEFFDNEAVCESLSQEIVIASELEKIILSLSLQKAIEIKGVFIDLQEIKLHYSIAKAKHAL